MTDRPLPASASYRNAYKHLTFSFWRNSLIMLELYWIICGYAILGLGNGVKAYIDDQVNSLANPTANSYSSSR